MSELWLKEWVAHGLPCRVKQHGMGHYCGYCDIPDGHPLARKDYTNDAVAALDVHGGVTYYGDTGQGWRFGWDAAHGDDFHAMIGDHGGRRWTLADAIAETERLAALLAAGGLE